MSDLKYIQKEKFEKLFDMSGGYVLYPHFSNPKIRSFVLDSIGIDMYENDGGLSKAKLLKKLIDNQNNYKTGKLLLDFLQYMHENNLINDDNISLYDSCKELANNLKNNSKIDNLNINNLKNDKTLELLLNEIEFSREKENPEIILDRLHTLATKYIKQLSEKYNIETKGKSLNGIFGLYIKELEKKGIIESDITMLIVKSNINILDKFNHIRNNQSLAHDNKILNSSESVFVINNIISLLHFIDTLEQKNPEQEIEDLLF